MLFLSVQFQLVGIERNMELENHHLSAGIITSSGKTHQWILKLDKVWGVTVYLQSLELILLKDTY